MGDAQRLKLLSDLARQMAKRPKFVGSDIDTLAVKFKTKRGRTFAELDLDKALEALADDVYIFEECDLSIAAQVELIQL